MNADTLTVMHGNELLESHQSLCGSPLFRFQYL
jgi:hypothetical protein